MSKKFRLNPETGAPEVMIFEEGGLILIGKEKRISNGRLINIHHFYDPRSNQMIFHLDGIRIDMLCYEGYFDDGEIYYSSENRDEEECEPVAIDYNAPLLFSIENDECRLTDIDGLILSGSNIHSHGVLCLGDSFNPMSMQALDMLLYNEPNHDLSWFGSPIGIKQNNIQIAEGKFCSEVTLWPTTSYSISMSQKTKDALAHLQP